MKKPLVAFAILSAFVAADAQVDRGGGIFGFGRKQEQISAGLFPDTAPVQTSAPVVYPDATTSPSAPAPLGPRLPEPNGENIFRNGSPQDVDSVSYVIENGEKVEKDDGKKSRGRLFGFGKKEEDEIVAPIPPATYTAPESAPAPVAVPAPAPIVSEAVSPRPEPVAEEIADAFPRPEDAEKEKKSGGMFSFFNRDKSKNDPGPVIAPVPNDAPIPAEPVVAEAPAPQPVASDPVSAPAPVPADPVPAPQPAPADPGPSFASADLPSQEPDQKKGGFSLPNPMKNLKAPSLPEIKAPNLPEIKQPSLPERKRNIDMTNAETIIANGEIVEQQDDLVETNMVDTSSGPRQAPQVVDGVTTYSSWDDVGGRSTSAADKILQQIR